MSKKIRYGMMITEYRMAAVRATSHRVLNVPSGRKMSRRRRSASLSCTSSTSAGCWNGSSAPSPLVRRDPGSDPGTSPWTELRRVRRRVTRLLYSASMSVSPMSDFFFTSLSTMMNSDSPSRTESSRRRAAASAAVTSWSAFIFWRAMSRIRSPAAGKYLIRLSTSYFLIENSSQ